jgi:chromosome segregation ATPase
MTADLAIKAGEVKHPGFPAAPQTRLTQGVGQPTQLAEPLAVVPDAHDEYSLLDGYNDTDSAYSASPPRNTNTMPPPLVDHHRPTPPPLDLVNAQHHQQRKLHHQSLASSVHTINTPNTDKPLPKSPGSSKLGSFFGWGSQSPVTPSDKHSQQGFSPIPSPATLSRTATHPDASPTTLRQSSHLQAPGSNSREYCDALLATPPNITPYSPSDQIQEMEDELKTISAELAASIRREMDLEDLVDKLQAERDNPTNKRSSDYFSDSGYSSAKFSEFDASREEIEKIQRRAEQEMAQVKLELTSKVQDERLKRQQLDEQIRELSTRASQIDLAQVNSMDASGRVKELEETCYTLRRKMSEEIKVKDNFEDLLAALRGELRNTSNERDNLRDEIVPQLRARVEGLEGQATELEKMTYESTKMQQELQALKFENDSLKRMGSMSSISEDPSFGDNRRMSVVGSMGMGLSRSNSVMNSSSSKRGALGGLSRSKSVKSNESREQLSDRLKDVEEQRDALHRALKSLLERQEHQNRENDKKIRALEMERDRLLTTSPQRAGFVKEVSNLRDEINTLRRRSEEALEQKWQVEKGLAGLKMDLDRAEQEIASLRSLLEEKDILIPEALARASASSDGSFAAPVTSESLTIAYAEVQAAYASALERVKELEGQSTSGDEKTMLAVQKLEQSLSFTASERDAALRDASSYKEQVEMLQAAEQTYLDSEKTLADELLESSRRVEELAAQVRQQLSSNQDLRQRLADTVARGETAQKTNTTRITDMQARLRTLEEQLVAAQTASEDRIARHEDEVSSLKTAHNEQLSRLSANIRSRSFGPKSPLSPLFAGSAKSPRLSSRRSGTVTVADESEVASLKEKVLELEKALAKADMEMEEVVSRMNTAQIEVLQLQEEREAAVSQTRKLERALQAEKVKAFEDRFKMLQT